MARYFRPLYSPLFDNVLGEPRAGGTAGAAVVQAFAFQAETTTLATALTTPPTANRKLWQDRTIRRLKTEAGGQIWTKARWLRFAGATADASQASLTNWKVPSEKATVVGSPVFTADQHVIGATGLNYINLGMNANVLSQNNLGVFVWTQTNDMNATALQTGSVMGVIDGSSNGISIVPKNATNDVSIRLAGAAISIGKNDGFGLCGASRSNSADIQSYFNGISRGTFASTSAALPALPIYLCGLNNNGSISNGNVVEQSFLYLGQALTAAEVKALSAIVGEYLEAVQYGDYYIEEPGVGTASITAQCVVYGMNGAGVHAAVAASRQGKTVALIGGWRDRFSFGMAGGGLGYTDYDDETALGGLPRWVITEMNRQSGNSDVAAGFSKLIPKRFNRTMRKLLKTYNIPVYLTRGVTSVQKTGTVVTRFTTADGRTVNLSQGHDASYTQDLARLAGLSYTKGRESAAQYSESNAGVRDTTTFAYPKNHAAANLNIDPFVTPGVPASGLLPGVHTTYSTFTPALHTFPVVGSADTRTTAYNFRLTWTTSTTFGVPLPSTPPTGFAAANYELHLRHIDAANLGGSAVTLADLFKIDELRSSTRWDINNTGILSTDFSHQSEGYPLGSYAEREVLWKAHWNYIMGLWYLLQYHADARIPATLRTEALTWMMCSDHYYSPHENDNQHEQPQIYEREAIRIVSDVVMNSNHMAQNDGATPTLGDHTVSVASYGMDSHGMHRVAYEVSAGVWATVSEGGMLVSAGGVNLRAPLPFEIFVPKVAECTNGSFSFGGSLTHVAYGSSRMEFTAMMTAYSMGWAMGLAIDGGTAIQSVPYATLRTALLASASLSGEVAPVLPQVT